MRILQNVSILRKITIVFTVVVSLVALSGMASYHLSGVLGEAADRQAQAGRLVIASKDALAAAIDLSSHLRGLVMTHAADNVPDIVKDQERFEARIADARTAAPLAAGLSSDIDGLHEAEAVWHRQFVDVVLPLAQSDAAVDQAQASTLMVAETNRRMVGDPPTPSRRCGAVRSPRRWSSPSWPWGSAGCCRGRSARRFCC